VVVYRGVNNGLLYDLWNAYDLDASPTDSGGPSNGLSGFVESGIEKVPSRTRYYGVQRARYDGV
jgi:hypothetical protein